MTRSAYFDTFFFVFGKSKISNAEKQKIMKKNPGMSSLAPRLGAGVALLALCAFTPLSRADVAYVNNTVGNSFANNGANFSTFQLVQTFTANSSGPISSLSLELTFDAGYAANDAYNVYFLDGTTETLIGHVSSATGGVQGLQLLSVNLDQSIFPTMTAGNAYGIVLDSGSGAAPGDVGWGFTQTLGSGGDATMTGTDRYFSSDGGANFTQDTTTPPTAYQMDLQVVPEVPMTGLIMGFGVLGMAVGGSVLRKYRPALKRID